MKREPGAANDELTARAVSPIPDSEAAARWAGLFARAAEAVALLDRQRRVRYANPAFEALAGVTADDALGLLCTTRRSKQPLSELGYALAPPPEVLAGRPASVRRGVPPARTGPPWWEVAFAPFTDPDGFLGAVARITPLGGPPATPNEQPLDEPLAALRDRAAARYDFELLAGRTLAARRAAAQARLAASTREPVLVVGPAGCGKRTWARVVHHQGVTRAEPFVTLDAAGLPPALAEAALDGPAGTLYVREPGRLPRETQARLAARLADRDPAAGPRVVAGCRPDLAGVTDELRHAVEVVSVRLPGLAERAADLPRLADAILGRARSAGLTAATGLTPSAWEAVLSYPWPGNVRQFDAALAAASAHATGPVIDRGDLPPEVRRAEAAAPAAPLELDKLLEAVERRLIELALRKHGGNKSKAAEMLSVWRTRLLRRMEALGVADPEA